MTLTDEALLDVLLTSPFEQGQARAELSAVPDGDLSAEVSAAVDMLVEEPFDVLPGEETVRS
jgi:hypothetical protein